MSDSTPTLERRVSLAIRKALGLRGQQITDMGLDAKIDDAARAALDASGNDGTKVPPLERPDYCEPHEFLLLASYCGDDNEDCTEARPCADCLALCNVFGEDGKFLREFDGYDPAIARTQEQSDGE